MRTPTGVSVALAAALAAGLVLPTQALGYAELVRKGYVNCTSCHHSPTGGGVLTSYGRALSADEISAWASEGESDFAYGAFAVPEGVDLGGDLRVVQTYRDTPRAREGRFILMQADLEAALTKGPLKGVGTVGVDFDGQPISRRHYFLASLSDEAAVRVGRFSPAFGVNVPDHVIVTRRGLGWDQNSETYNVEGSWIGEGLNLYATGVFGRPGLEKGAAASMAVPLAEGRFKVGSSYFYGTLSGSTRHVFGPHAVLAFSPEWVLLSELDAQLEQSGGSTTRGLAAYHRLSYEFSKGWHAVATQEFSKLDFTRNSSLVEVYGLGLNAYPRPHLEVQLLWSLQKVAALGGHFSDFAWLVAHFYL